MDKRVLKQIIIAVIFFAILGGAGFGVFRVVVPVTPTPTPNPTLNLVPIQVISSQLISVASGDYDFVAQVRNPNTEYGSGAVNYELDFVTADTTPVEKRLLSFFILPGQTKYIVDTPLHLPASVVRAQMAIKSIDWQKLDPVAANGINLIVKNVSDFQPSSGPASFGTVSGTIINSSDLDLNTVNAVVVLTDDNHQPIAVNSTEIRTFLAQTTRGFEATWYTPFSGTVKHVEVEAQTNLFENSNFLRQYGGNQQKFQQLY